jgi:hypothetical protein
MAGQTAAPRPSITEVFRERSRERRRNYERVRAVLLRLLQETADSPQPVDVIAQVSEKTGVGEPDVQNALFAMEAAQEIHYERHRYLVNEDA